MQDAIIKGNGNSRYLKTVAAALSLYPTYEDFLQALIAGTFPIDLNGINAEGWTQQGTPLNKASLLSDATAISLGLGTDATVADALAKLLSNINTVDGEAARIETGSYVGTGTYGESNPNTLTLDFAPQHFVFLGYLDANGTLYISHYGRGQEYIPMEAIPADTYRHIHAGAYNAAYNMYMKKSSDGRTITWYAPKGSYDNGYNAQKNTSGCTYFYAYW